MPGLTEREVAVLKLASEGNTDKVIGQRLSISPGTIGNYWTRIRLKLAASSRTEAVSIFKESEAEVLKVEGQQLAEELKQQVAIQQELRVTQDELQRLIDERTSELTAINEQLKNEIRIRNQTEQALSYSERRYQHLYEFAEAGMFRSRINGSEILEINQKLLHILGGTRSDFIGKPTAVHWVSPSDRDAMVQQALRDGHVRDRECELRTLSGETKTCLLSAKLDRQEGVFEGSLIDITDRKKMEFELMKSESQLRALIDTIPDPAWLKDSSCRYMAVNSAWCAFCGSESAKAIGRTDHDLFDEPFAAEFMKTDQLVLDTRRTHHYEEGITQNGRDIWFETIKTPVIDAHGEVVALAGIARDITERKKREDLQQQSMQFAMGVIDGISSHIAVIDHRGLIIAVNKAWKEFAIENDMPDGHDCVGDNYLDVCLCVEGAESAEAQSIREGILEVLNGSSSVFEMEYRCDGPDKERWFLVRVTPFPGTSDGMVVIEHENISVIKENEKRLKLSNERYQNFISQSHESVSCIEFTEPIDTHLPLDEQIDAILERAYVGESNEAMARLFGLNHADDSAGLRISGLDWGYDGLSIREDTAVFIRQGYQRQDWEAKRTTREGRVIDTLSNHKGIVEDGKLTRIWITTIDISDRKRAEERTAHSYSLLEAALESTEDGILITDGHGMMVQWNQKFLEMWGIPADIKSAKDEGKAIEQAKRLLVDPDQFLKQIQAVYATPDLSTFDVLHFKDGRAIERYSQPQILSGKVVGRVWSFRDVTKRIAADKALKESEARFKTAFETSPDAININRMPDGLYIEVNEGFLKLTGFEREEVIGKSSLDLGIWVDVEDRVRLVSELKDHGYVSSLEMRYRTKQGVIGHALMSARTIVIDGETCILSVTRDITERKRVEDTLRLSEERFSSAFAYAPIGFALVALDGTWLKVNRSLCAILGYSEEEFAQRKFTDITHPDDLEDDLEHRRQLLAGEIKSFRKDKRYINKKGQAVWVTVSVSLVRDANGQPLHFIAQVQDITERKKSEDALRESESRFRAITANTPDLIIVQDLDLRYQLVVNPPLGFKEDDMIGKTDREILSPADAETLTRIKKEVIKKRKTISVELPIANVVGNLEYFNGTYVPRYDADGKVNGLIGYFRNVTDLKKGVEDLHRAVERLDQTQVAAGAGSWDFNFETGEMIWSDQLFKLFGLDPLKDKASFETWRSVMHPFDAKRAEDRFKETVETGERLENEYRIVLPDGTWRWIAAIGTTSYTEDGRPLRASGICIDITSRTNAVNRQLMAVEVLKILNTNDSVHDSLEELLKTIQRYTGYDAVAIRLKEGSDYPYYVCNGFSPEFVKYETHLCSWSHGCVNVDAEGNPILECTCGLVLSGKTDPLNPLFTPFGSAWINHSEDILSVPRDQDPRTNPRNRCVHEGYHSVALIPIRLGDQIVGLLQLNDHQPDCFDVELIQFFEGIGTSIGIALSRRQSAERLFESEQKFRALFNSMAVGIVLFDAETLRFLMFNEAAPSILGYSSEEYAQLTVLNIEALHDEAMIRSNVVDCVRGQSLDFETVHLTKTGELRNVDVRASSIDLGGKKVVLAIYSDITNRKRLQETLAEHDRYHRQVLESLPDIVMRFDGEGRHLFVSENVIDIVDIRAEEFIGKTHRELGFPEHLCDLWEESIQKTFRSGEVFETEFCIDGKSGQAIFNWRLVPEFDVDGEVTSVLSISRNVTAHRKAEQDFAMLFQEMLDGFALHEIICDDQGKPVDYRFLAVNPAFERLTHLDGAAIVGKTVLEVMPDTERYWIERYGHVALTGEPAFFNDYSSALDKYFEVSAFQPAPMQFACVFEDVTAQVRATQALQLAHDELEEKVAERTTELEIANHELESFSYSVSHDLRAPLRTLGGFSSIMLTDYADKLDEDGRFYLNRISSMVDTMGELIDGLLRLSRINQVKLNRQPLNLSKQVREIADSLIETNPSRKVEFKIEADVWADADMALVRSLLENLIANAWKYTGNKPVAVIEFGANSDGDRKVYRVKDNGAGFDMAFSNKLFGTFQRLHNEKEFPGIGIGLATVRRIVRRHGGEVWAEAAVDKGASFFFTLCG